MTYSTYVQSRDQAVVHLAFHCCLKDGELQPEELDFLATTFAAKGINRQLNLKEEMEHYRSYYKTLSYDSAYVKYLLDTIHPKNKLALFAFCAEIIYRDNHIAISEEVLLNEIANHLSIRSTESSVVQDLITELNDVEENNAF